jgi:hypothetical protein
LFLHRFEIPLHAIDPDGEDVHEAQVLGVLGGYRRAITVKRHVVADQHPITNGEGKPHGLVVGVSDAD